MRSYICVPMIASSYIHVFLWKGVAPVEPSPVLNCKTSCGQLYPQLDLSEFLKAVQPETEDVAEGEEQVLAVGICCVRSARHRRRG